MENELRQLPEPSMEDIIHFLATYRLDASKKRWPIQNSLRVANAIINRDVKPEEVTRKYIARKTGLNIAKIDYSLGELRKEGLLGPEGRIG